MHWHWYLLGMGTVALMAGAGVVCGGVAVRTDWLLPWLRRRTVRPKMWGYGAMLAGTGLLLAMASESLDGFGGTSILDGAVWFTGLLLMIAGGWFQALGARERVDA